MVNLCRAGSPEGRAPGPGPGDASGVLRAGAAAVLFRMLRLLEDDAEPTPADLQMMDDIEAELSEFGRDVQAGRR